MVSLMMIQMSLQLLLKLLYDLYHDVLDIDFDELAMKLINVKLFLDKYVMVV
jgi:hypothetical protein